MHDAPNPPLGGILPAAAPAQAQAAAGADPPMLGNQPGGPNDGAGQHAVHLAGMLGQLGALMQHEALAPAQYTQLLVLLFEISRHAPPAELQLPPLLRNATAALAADERTMVSLASRLAHRHTRRCQQMAVAQALPLPHTTNNTSHSATVLKALLLTAIHFALRQPGLGQALGARLQALDEQLAELMALEQAQHAAQQQAAQQAQQQAAQAAQQAAQQAQQALQAQPAQPAGLHAQPPVHLEGRGRGHGRGGRFGGRGGRGPGGGRGRAAGLGPQPPPGRGRGRGQLSPAIVAQLNAAAANAVAAVMQQFQGEDEEL